MDIVQVNKFKDRRLFPIIWFHIQWANQYKMDFIFDFINTEEKNPCSFRNVNISPVTTDKLSDDSRKMHRYIFRQIVLQRVNISQVFVIRTFKYTCIFVRDTISLNYDVHSIY